MKQNRVLLTVAATILALACTSQAGTVYVSESATDITLSEYSTGYGGQDGSLGNPFGTIQAAYRYLWTQTGDHEIRLIGDEDGIFHDGEVGTQIDGEAIGTLRFVHPNFPTGAVAYNSITLKPDDPVNNPVALWFSKNQTSNTDIASNTNLTFPDRGGNGQPMGLINPGTLMNNMNLKFENLTIDLDGGTYLIGTAAQGTAGNNWNFDFINVNLLLRTDNVNLPGDIADNFGRSGLYFSTQNGAQGGVPDIRAGVVEFFNSNIYYDPVGRIGNDGLMAAHGYASTDIFRTTGFFDGNNSSRIWKWTTGSALSSATLHDNLNDDIYAGVYNMQSPPAGFSSAGNYHQVNENGTYLSPGSGTAPMFLVNFIIPEPTTALMVSLAGAAFLMLGRRR